MNIILDTNILISALIKDSATRRIIIESGLNLFYPENSFKEILKHKEYILKKADYSGEEFLKIINKLLEYINLIPLKIIEPRLKEANKIMEKIDINDVIFIASALSLNGLIWSEDKDFDKQPIVKVVKTKYLIKIFGKDS